MTLMIVSHDAFRRDLGHLKRAVEQRSSEDPQRRRAVQAGWEMFKLQLENHHTNEDKSIWPRMRNGLRDRPDDLLVLDAMEAEHERIDPLLAAVDGALADPEAGHERFAQAITELDATLTGHLTHEERDALPLVQVALTPDEWQETAKDMRELIGLKGAADFFPWLLDGASDKDSDAVLKVMPAPARMMYRRMWVPKYKKVKRWA
jgi:iron-sulfur cluster repair protein YtfE (RIC family)